MFKTSIRFSVLSLFLVFGAQAQEVFKLNSSGGGFNVMVGYQGINADSYFQEGQRFDCGVGEEIRTTSDNPPVPTSFNRAIYKKPSGGILTTGFQGYGAFNSIIIGGEFNTFYGASKSGTQRDSSFAVQNTNPIQLSGTTSRLAGADALLNIGFVAFRKRGFIAYPMVGIGYGASGLWLQSQSNSRTYPLLTKVVTDGDNNLQNMFIWTRNAVLDFGLGAQYMFGASTEDRAKGFSLGLRFGYKMQLETDNVLVNANKQAKDSFADTDNVAIPKLGYSGAYVKLLIGFGRIGEAR
jgi:hypothetical protein